MPFATWTVKFVSSDAEYSYAPISTVLLSMRAFPAKSTVFVTYALLPALMHGELYRRRKSPASARMKCGSFV